MIQADKCVCVVVDVQEKLSAIMQERETLCLNLQKLVRGMQILKVPIVWVEHVPEKMGPTIQAVRDLMADMKPITKSSFSCCLEKSFLMKLTDLGRTQVLLSGIEAHVCIYQTAADLVRLNYEVEVVADAVSSRTQANRTTGLDRMRTAGAGITSVETVLFEMVRVVDHPACREILKLVK